MTNQQSNGFCKIDSLKCFIRKIIMFLYVGIIFPQFVKFQFFKFQKSIKKEIDVNFM